MADIWKILRKYGLSQYLFDFVNKLEFTSKRQWKLMLTKLYIRRKNKCDITDCTTTQNSSDSANYKTRYKSHPYYKPSLSNVFLSKKLMVAIARAIATMRMWVTKPTFVRQCSYCRIVTEDILLHTVTDCPYLWRYILQFMNNLRYLNYELVL